jgi:hypothetical protein
MELSSANATHQVLHLRRELWVLVDDFRCFLGSDGTETEQGRSGGGSYAGRVGL